MIPVFELKIQGFKSDHLLYPMDTRILFLLVTGITLFKIVTDLFLNIVYLYKKTSNKMNMIMKSITTYNCVWQLTPSKFTERYGAGGTAVLHTYI